MKKELIFLGPPACGKGTQTSRLAEYLGFPHIDTGSLLRAEIARETEEGKIAKFHIDQGHLVPVDLVATIIGKRLAQPDCDKGYVLDGYPRSMEQALKLEDINEEVMENHLYTAGLPNVDLMIRTSGEIRTSNFLPWQIAYAEYVFTPVYFPDFKRKEFVDCLIEFNKRNRRYGGLDNEKEDN